MAIEDFKNIEFGVCRLVKGEYYYNRIPIDQNVKISLSEMYDSFYQQYNTIEGEIEEFSSSEKYSAEEKLIIATNNEYVSELNALYQNQNITINEQAFSEVASEIHYYFGIFYDNRDMKKIGVKRPTQFKGLLKKRGQLVRLVDDTLKVIEDDVFRLDNDFD